MFNFVRKEYETRRQKQIDFALGVAIWIGLNAVMLGIQIGLISLSSSVNPIDNPALSSVVSIAAVVCSILPWIVNIAAIIVLAIYRRWMAFGMLATIGALMALVICLGIVLIGACSTGLLNNI